MLNVLPMLSVQLHLSTVLVKFHKCLKTEELQLKLDQTLQFSKELLVYAHKISPNKLCTVYKWTISYRITYLKSTASWCKCWSVKDIEKGFVYTSQPQWCWHKMPFFLEKQWSKMLSNKMYTAISWFFRCLFQNRLPTTLGG